MRLFKALGAVLLFSALALAQATHPLSCSLATTQTCTIGNGNGAFAASFEEVPSGSPATVSVTVQGCMNTGNTCDAAADTNTATTAAIRGVTFTKVYDYFKVTATLSGGTAPVIVVNPTISTANSHAGSSVTGTAPIVVSGTAISCPTCGTGTGSVSSASVTTANGVSGTVATPTTTPAITLTLGAITPTSVAIGGGTALTSSNQTGTGSLVLADSPALVTPTLDVATGTSLALGGGTALATTNQTGTGSLVLATSPTLVTPALGTPASGVATNLTGFPTLNQNTTGTAANLSGTPALPSGTTATTQTAGDISTDLSNDAFVAAAVAAAVASGTVGQPSVYTSTGGIGSSPIYYDVTKFTGATADIKLSNCLTAVSSGGVCDARGYGATTQTIAATVSIGLVAAGNKQVVVFSPATSFIPSTSSTQMFTLGPWADVAGLHIDTSSQVSYSVAAIIIAGYYGGTNGAYQAAILKDSWVNGGANWTSGSACLELTTPSTSASTYYARVNGFECNNLYDGILLYAPNTSTGGVNANTLTNIKLGGSVYPIELNGSSGFANPALQMSGNVFSNVTSEWNSSNTIYQIYVHGNAYANNFTGLELFDATTTIFLSGTSGGTGGSGVNGNFFEGYISPYSDTTTGLPNNPNMFICQNCLQGQSNFGGVNSLWLNTSGHVQTSDYTNPGGYIACCVGSTASEEFISSPGISGAGTTGWHWYTANNSTGALNAFVMSLDNTGLLTTGSTIRAGGGVYEASTSSQALSLLGGLSSSGINQTQGGLFARGADSTGTGASEAGGFALLRGGMLTNTTPSATALEGVVQISAGFLKGTAVANVGDVVCGTTTAFTVTDCSHTGPAVNIIGIATYTANPLGVITNGLALVKLSAALTAIGDTVCMGTTTDGLAVDSGGVGVCATAGTSIGVIVADSGTVTTAFGANTAAIAMSTTLPLVKLNIGK